MLKIENLHVYYGGIHALQGINLEVPDRQIISLMEPTEQARAQHSKL